MVRCICGARVDEIRRWDAFGHLHVALSCWTCGQTRHVCYGKLALNDTCDELLEVVRTRPYSPINLIASMSEAARR